jgi:hypothetical protein
MPQFFFVLAIFKHPVDQKVKFWKFVNRKVINEIIK